jgi:hypothetical protein
MVLTVFYSGGLAVKTYSHLQKDDLTRQLIAAGCLMGNKQDDHSEIVMWQGPVNFESCLIELDHGRTGVILSLIIQNPPTLDRLIRLDLQRFRIEIPWCRQFDWLEDPISKGPRPYLYSFPGMRTLSFGRDEVLNHRLGHGGALLPGDELEGLLMGVGEGAMPDEFHDRQRFSTHLSAYYERGKLCDLGVDLMVRREAKKKASERKLTPDQAKARDARMAEIRKNWPM